MSSPKEVLLGRLAIQRGVLSQEELDLALQVQTERGGDTPLGELLVDLGLISRAQLDELIAAQRENLQAPSPYSESKTVGEDLFGRRAVEASWITEEQLKHAIKLQGLSQRSGHPKRMGQILVEQRYLTQDQVRELLSGQGKRIFGCTVCHTNYNVQGAPPIAALTCRRCGTPLEEMEAAAPAADASPATAADAPPPPRTPSVRKATPAANRLKADGTWYPRPSPRSVPDPRKTSKPTKTSRAAASAEYLPYERRVKVKPQRGPWVAVGAVTLALAVVLVVVQLSSPGQGGEKQHTASTTPTPSPSDPARAEPPPTPISAGLQAAAGPETPDPKLEELKAFLATHKDDPVACVRAVRRVGFEFMGTDSEEEFARLKSQTEEPVLARGSAAYRERVEASARLAKDDRFGQALQALTDLPADQDPLGDWNGRLRGERAGVEQAAQSRWEAIAADAMKLASAGKWEEAISLVQKVEGFGVPRLRQEAEAYRLALVDAQAKWGAAGGDAEAAKVAARKAEEERKAREERTRQAKARAVEAVKEDLDKKKYAAVWEQQEKVLEDPSASEDAHRDATYVEEEIRRLGDEAMDDANEHLRMERYDEAAEGYKRIAADFKGTPWGERAVAARKEALDKAKEAHGRVAVERMPAPQLLRYAIKNMRAQQGYHLGVLTVYSYGGLSHEQSREADGIVRGKIFCSKLKVKEFEEDDLVRYSAGYQTLYCDKGNWKVESWSDCRFRSYGQNPRRVLSLLDRAASDAVFDGAGLSKAPNDAQGRKIKLVADAETVKAFLQIVYKTTSVKSFLNLKNCKVEFTIYVDPQDNLVHWLETSEHLPLKEDWYGRTDQAYAWDFFDFNKNLEFTTPPDVELRLRNEE